MRAEALIITPTTRTCSTGRGGDREAAPRLAQHHLRRAAGRFPPGVDDEDRGRSSISSISIRISVSINTVTVSLRITCRDVCRRRRVGAVESGDGTASAAAAG